MPTMYFATVMQYTCEGCHHQTRTRKDMKKHIYFMRKDRNKDGKNHR